MKLETPSQSALHLWDYFYISRYPKEGEEKVWRRIECATQRIRESEPFLRDATPAPVRLESAKRVRRATREIARLIDQLDSIPEPWIGETVARLEALAERLIAASRAGAETRPRR